MATRETKPFSKIQELEKLNENLLSIQDLRLLLAVFLDMKPISEITISSSNETILGQKLEELAKVCKKLGIHMRAYGNYKNTQTHECSEPYEYNIFVSKDEDIIPEHRIDVKMFADTEEANKFYGNLLGFPLTAIEAFNKKQTIRIYDLPDVITPEEFAFLFFAPSVEHLQEELKIVRKFARIVKRKSPKLYKKIVDNAVNFFNEERKISQG